MNLIKTCSFSLALPCKYILADIQGLWIADTRNSEYIFDSNIIADIINVTWYKIGYSDFKITQNISKNSEEVILDIQIPFLNGLNQKILSDVKKTFFSFLLLDKNNNLFYVDKTRNVNYIETFNPNGFTLKQNAAASKSLFQVDYNYYLFNFVGVQDTVDVCSSYYNDLALDSIQPNALSIQCLVQDYSGWV